jgi:hypothetical protein
MDEGLRLHLALCTVAERLAGVMEGARFERRRGYVLMMFPTFPIPSFNGVWPDLDSAAGALGGALAEVEAEGIAPGPRRRRVRPAGGSSRAAVHARSDGFGRIRGLPRTSRGSRCDHGCELCRRRGRRNLQCRDTSRISRSRVWGGHHRPCTARGVTRPEPTSPTCSRVRSASRRIAASASARS